MQVSLKDAKNDLTKNIKGLPLNYEFKENVVMDTIISDIEKMLNDLSPNDDSIKITMKNVMNSIEFKYINEELESEILISVNQKPNELFYVKREQGQSHSIMGNDYSFKSVVNSKASFKKGDKIEIYSISLFSEKNILGSELYENNKSIRSREYTKKGIMRSDLYLRAPQALSSNNKLVDLTKEDIDNYEERQLLERDMLDTARLTVDDRINNVRYSGIIPLDQKWGLRDMYISNNNRYPTDTIINPLSKAEIENLINKESNLIVRDGLRSFANGRENYSYNAKEDKDFLCSFGQIKHIK